MAVNNQTLLLVATLILNYLIIYPKNRLVGAIIFLGVGVLTMLQVNIAYGILIIVIGLIAAIYDGIASLSPQKSGYRH